jgi:hypothetical protein
MLNAEIDTRRTTVIFQHIPKAAGTTLNAILTRYYSPDETYSLVGSAGFREAEFAQLPIEDRARFRLIKGHLYFGIHRYLPSPFTYITILRHPVDRVLSHFHYVKRSPQHYLYGHVTSKQMTLEEYVSSGISLELNNGQVRCLVGPDHQNVGYGECSRAMLEQAQRHLLTNYSVVGIANRFDEALLLMRRRLGWSSSPLYVPKNVTRNKPQTSSLPRRIIQLIERDNALDMELYENAARAFAKETDQWILRGELVRFQVLNSIYAQYVSSARVARKMVHRWRPLSTSS